MQVISASDFFFFFTRSYLAGKIFTWMWDFSLSVLVIFFVTRKKDECVT